MTARDAAIAELDRAVDGLGAGASAAELFAVVDVLDAQPSLRRSLSDPSASDDQRAGLARRLFGGKLGAESVAVIGEVVKAPWGTGQRMASALERQAVRLALKTAVDNGNLADVVAQLNSLAAAVSSSHELNAALRDRSYPVAAKQELIDRLIAGQALPATRTLASRAVKARRRNFTVTLQSYLEMAAGLLGTKIARVTVARPLDQARIDRLKAALEAQTGTPISIQIEVDPAVIGGMSVAIGDDVIESTVAGRLEQARRQLINL